MVLPLIVTAFTGDWPLDSAEPATSPIWREDLLGGARAGECIQSGAFYNLSSPVPFVHCVTRGFNSGVAGGMGDVDFDGRDVLAALVASGGRGNRHSSSFANFTAALELSHAAAHIGIGAALMRRPDVSGVGPNVGDMFYMSRSAGDPVFFSLHAAVDRYWMARQYGYPESQRDFGGLQGGVRVRSTDVLPPFNHTADDTFIMPCVAYAAPPRRAPTPRGRSGRSHHTTLSGEKEDADSVRRGREPRNRLLAAYLAANGRSAGEIERAEEVLDEAAVEAAIGYPGNAGGGSSDSSVVNGALSVDPGPRTQTTTSTTPSPSTTKTTTAVPIEPVVEAVPVAPIASNGQSVPRQVLPTATRRPGPVVTRQPAVPLVSPRTISTHRPPVVSRPPPVVPRRPVSVPRRLPVANTPHVTPRRRVAPLPRSGATRRPVSARRPTASLPLRSAATRRPVAPTVADVPPPVAPTRRPVPRATEGRPTVTRRPVTTATPAGGGVQLLPRSAGRGG